MQATASLERLVLALQTLLGPFFTKHNFFLASLHPAVFFFLDVGSFLSQPVIKFVTNFTLGLSTLTLNHADMLLLMLMETAHANVPSRRHAIVNANGS